MGKRTDGEREGLPVTGPPSESADDAKLTLLAEELSVGKETVETGRLRVSKETRTRDANIDATLFHEHAEVERLPIGRQIFEMPSIRQEGETTIIPVVEEVVHIERRLVLKEEVRITRRRTSERFQDRVTLRYQEAIIFRVQGQTQQADAGSADHVSPTKTREQQMSYETLVAVYDTPDHADAAVKALKAAGFAGSDISVFDQSRLKAGKSTLSTGVREAGLWHRLFGGDVHQHEADIYGQTVEDGGVVISVRVPDSEVAHATAVLDIHRPVDVHDRAVTTGAAPAAHVEAIEKKLDAVPLTATQKIAVSPKLAAAQPDILRLAEEQLQVGKEMTETGRTRVRRFVTERDVSADVTLHEEHAEVLRKAISDPKYVGDIDWTDRTIEVVETKEHALVNKTARIVEEVALRKIGADHIETIRDKIRRQQVEVERVGADGKVIPPGKTV